MRRHAPGEVVGEPALAHPGGAEKRGDRGAPVATHDLGERVEQSDLLLATDQRRFEAVHVLAGKRAFGDGFPHRERLGLALRHDRLVRPVLDRSRGLEVGLLPELVGRLSAIVRVPPLSEETLSRIISWVDLSWVTTSERI